MPLWGNRDQYSDAPKYQITGKSANTGQDRYGNNVFMADDAEVGVNKNLNSPGWQHRILGTGPVQSITISSGGTGYSNSDTVKVSGGTVNAAANLTTNSTGGIISTTITNTGAGFSNNSSSTLAITTSGGTTANLVFTLGGRANRERWETLVTITSVQGDAVLFANTSSANVANSSGTADDSILPDS